MRSGRGHADGSCVVLAAACDGTQDCPDGSDEPPGNQACADACQPSEFICSSGKCVSKSESGCSCSAGELMCSDGECIDNWICDGIVDCSDTGDEFCCDTDTWLCLNGYECIPLSYRCDEQYTDCSNGSDEAGC